MSCQCAHLKRLKKSGTGYEEKSAVYMDYNAAAPPDRRVLALYQNTALNAWAHPSSPHMAGQNSRDMLDRAEEICRGSLTGEFSRIEFTDGSTGALRRVLEYDGGKIITSCCDHAAILEQAKAPVLLNVDGKGKIDLQELERTLGENPSAMIVYSPVNHETGAVQDCSAIWNLAAAAESYVFIDAAQSAVRMDEEEWLPYCHGFCLSSQKLSGLKGLGILMAEEEFPLKSQHHEGTPDVPGALALAETLSLYKEEKKRLLQEQNLLVREGWDILKAGSFDIVRAGPEDSVPGVLCVALPGLPALGKSMEDLFYHLNLRGIFLSRFSACSGSVNGSSEILKAMGRPEEICTTSLRISLGKGNKREDFFRLRKALDEFHSS